MKALEYPDRHCLNFAMGWMALGCPSEARAEVEKITVFGRFHPEAMCLRWKVLARLGQWPLAQDVARLFTKICPTQARSWLCLAYSLYRVGKPLEAWLTLLPKAAAFPKVSAIPYLLACLARENGQESDTRRWLAKSAALGGPEELEDNLLVLDGLTDVAPEMRAEAGSVSMKTPKRSPVPWTA